MMLSVVRHILPSFENKQKRIWVSHNFLGNWRKV